MDYKYAMQVENENSARAVGKSLPISNKQSVEICGFIRGKKLQKAKDMLKQVIEKKMAVPYKRYNQDVGHKTGIAAGRYPMNASKNILALLEGVEANAQFKGLNTSNLVIKHICAHKAAKQWHYGRKRRRVMKKATIEVIVVEEGEKHKERKEGNKK